MVQDNSYEESETVVSIDKARPGDVVTYSFMFNGETRFTHFLVLAIKAERHLCWVRVFDIVGQRTWEWEQLSSTQYSIIRGDL